MKCVCGPKTFPYSSVFRSASVIVSFKKTQNPKWPLLKILKAFSDFRKSVTDVLSMKKMIIQHLNNKPFKNVRMSYNSYTSQLYAFWTLSICRIVAVFIVFLNFLATSSYSIIPFASGESRTLLYPSVIFSQFEGVSMPLFVVVGGHCWYTK